MKLIHTSDWHLGDSLHGYDRQAEHAHFLDWLLSTLASEQPDALLLSGDIYDNSNPSAETERMLYTFLTQAAEQNPGLQIILTAGNHDSARRLEAPAAFYALHGIHVRGLVARDDEGGVDYSQFFVPIQSRTDAEDRVVVLAVPFLHQGDLPEGKTVSDQMRQFFDNASKAARKTCGKHMPLILMAHFYATGAEVLSAEHSESVVVGGQECVDAEGLGKKLAYVALGHIHKAQTVARQDNVRYAGSVLPMTFAERNYTHGVQVVTIADGEVATERLTYEPLRHMLSLPMGRDASAVGVLAELATLPMAELNDAGDSWPYLEVRVQAQEDDVELVPRIRQAVDGRAVRLCRIKHEQSVQTNDAEQMELKTVGDLQHINPAVLARQAWSRHFGAEMPDDIARLFADVKRQCEAEENE